MKKPKIVITGASGFIGRHVIQLLSENNQIEIIPLSRRVLPNFKTVSTYEDAPDGDILIHLADDSNVGSAAYNSSQFLNSSLLTTKSLSMKSYEKIIYASSALVYSDKFKTPRTVNDETSIENRYARLKKESEDIILSNPKGIVVRISNVYGMGMSSKSLIGEVLDKLKSEAVIEIRDSAPVRDFIHVNDVAEGISMIALSCISNLKNKPVYNLGTGIGTSIGELSLIMTDLAGQARRRIKFRNFNSTESCIILDSSLTEEIFGWKFRTPLELGLSKFFLKGEME